MPLNLPDVNEMKFNLLKYFSKATSHDLGDCNLVSAMGSIKQIAVKLLLFFFSTAVLEFLELGSKYVDLSLFAMLLHSVVCSSSST